MRITPLAVVACCGLLLSQVAHTQPLSSLGLLAAGRSPATSLQLTSHTLVQPEWAKTGSLVAQNATAPTSSDAASTASQPADVSGSADSAEEVAQEAASATAEHATETQLLHSSAGMAGMSVSYGDHLFRDGDYYRAITEYRRYLFLTRGAGTHAYRVAMAIGESYLRGREYAAAASQFESVAQRAPDGRLRGVALLSAGRAHLLTQRPLLATAALAAARQASQEDPEVASEALYLMGWARLAQKDYESARSAFGEIARTGGYHAKAAQQLLTRFDERETLEGKNPLVAGVLSLIPGAGHMYLGQWSVGVTALLWNALFVFATGYSIWTQEWGVAAVLGVFELSWFSGTMFGALNGAMRYNRDLESNWLDDLTGAFGKSRELRSLAEVAGQPGKLERFYAPTVPGKVE